jgi:putative addiction module component (TIGR02574 family)
MNAVVEQWKSQLMTLPQDDRAELAHFLICSLDPEDEDNEVERAWEAEVARRFDGILSGQVNGRPANELLVELRERYPRFLTLYDASGFEQLLQEGLERSS